jgi:hypothetical protein
MGIGVDMSYASYVVLAQKRIGEQYGLKFEYRQLDTGVGGVLEIPRLVGVIR